MGGFVSHGEKLTGPKVRARGEKFFDHFTQARLFYQSQTDIEKDHIVSAFRFELGKVEVPDIRQRMVGIIAQVDANLAERVASGLGLSAAVEVQQPINRSIPADENPQHFQPRASRSNVKPSPELSIVRSAITDSIKTRRVAVLAADGCDDSDLTTLLAALEAAGAQAKIVAPKLGYLQTSAGNKVKIHFSLLTASSVLFDAVFVPGGQASVAALANDPATSGFISEAFSHAKAIGVAGAAAKLLEPLGPRRHEQDEGIVVSESSATEKAVSDFIAAVGKHRNWGREKMLRTDLRTE